MSTFAHQVRINLLLHFRNTMALIYGYVFPTIFLIAFWALYRYDQVPLVRHMGELLTITVLGGACFGLPTTMVSERERGVWRRYRLAPVSTGSLVLSTVAARYVLLIGAGLLQVGLAMGLGMPLPKHPFDLWLAFTFVAFAFLGLGLVIAMLADNVPAVQALGQCLFLPMLIVGGVAVPLTSLPVWAEHLSAFLPGRYAVEAIQSAVSGAGSGPSRFSLLALLAIGAAGSLAGAKLFRWDKEQKFMALDGKKWVAAALVAWVAVGAAAEYRGRIAPVVPPGTGSALGAADILTSSARQTAQAAPAPLPAAAPTPAPAATAPVASTTTAPSGAPGRAAAARGTAPQPAPARGTAAAGAKAASADSTDTAHPDAPVAGPIGPPRWQDVTVADVDRDLTFDRLPLDRSVVTPIAAAGQEADADLADQLANLEDTLLTWTPGLVTDPVQRTRNLLGVAGLHDVAQTPLEPYVPRIVFRRLLDESSREELIKALYWIAVHPEEGHLLTLEESQNLELKGIPTDEEEVRNRIAIYAVKLLGRLTGHIK